jgi:diguanylate cyclase (GGDEF)-like protein
VSQTQSLVAKAYVDALTQVYNRRKYNEVILLEWKRAIRHNYAVSLLLFDIDNFKHYNDTYGHACGDSALAKIAEALNPLAHRCEDTFCRYGGEEFALILPECTKDGAIQKAIEAIEIVKAEAICHEGIGSNDFLSISVGVATVTPSIAIDSIDLFKQADIALYNAKNNGRNGYSVSKTE